MQLVEKVSLEQELKRKGSEVQDEEDEVWRSQTMTEEEDDEGLHNSHSGVMDGLADTFR